MNAITLNLTTRKVGKDQTPREYFDFIVSGKSLRSVLGIEDDDLITPLGWGTNIELGIHILNVFKLKEKPRLESGRVMIYVCPECGDIDCGAITAKIKDSGDRIIWFDFGYETGYGGLSETYQQIEPIEFIRQNYFAVFSTIHF